MVVKKIGSFLFRNSFTNLILDAINSGLIKDDNLWIAAPYLNNQADWLKKGLHITAMGSDAEQKNELDPHIIKECDVYVPDNQLQTSILGELNHAIKAGLISVEKKYKDLGSIIINPNLGRRNSNDVTQIYGSKVIPNIKKHIKATNCILDGELLVWDSVTGKYEDFGKYTELGSIHLTFCTLQMARIFFVE